MAIFSDGAAMALAQDAKESAVRVELLAAALSVELRSHVAECSRSWAQMDANFVRAERDRQADLREWRDSLGKRLDRQDKVQWSALVGVVVMLLSVLAYFMEHSGAFAFK
jgi:hypothetical protein